MANEEGGGKLGLEQAKVIRDYMESVLNSRIKWERSFCSLFLGHVSMWPQTVSAVCLGVAERRGSPLGRPVGAKSPRQSKLPIYWSNLLDQTTNGVQG